MATGDSKPTAGVMAAVAAGGVEAREPIDGLPGLYRSDPDPTP
jgi:hypothetical protein